MLPDRKPRPGQTSCRQPRQQSTHRRASAPSTTPGRRGTSWDTCRAGVSADTSTCARTWTSGWPAHLYDPQPRHEVTPERIPTYVGVLVRGELADEAVEAILGAWLFLAPLVMAFVGWMTW